MSVPWTARALTTTLTLMFLTQPGFASPRTVARHAPAGASHQQLVQVMKRGEQVPAAVRLRHEDRLAALAAELDVEEAHDPSACEVRVATEFHVEADQLMNQHHDCGGSWGDLVIAHTLCANSSVAITPQQVFALHKDGMAWTMVAHGLGLDIEQSVQAIQAVRQVALGESMPDRAIPRIGAAGAANTASSE